VKSKSAPGTPILPAQQLRSIARKNGVKVGRDTGDTLRNLEAAKVDLSGFYKAKSAQEAQQTDYGSRSYWDYLEAHAKELFAKGHKNAFTRSLSEALQGNDGES
jgi:hypothetical protein